ncbi:MAG TPA: hypothetical protein VFS67_02120 [Polyangiaceae bacterium]|nr:hypothetical protein [Polyangiaceae bacterium]
MSEVFEQVMAQCARGSFTGLLRVQTREGNGEVRFLSGIQDGVRFDSLSGDAALARLQAASEPEFEAIAALPPIDASSTTPVPIEGGLDRIHAATLMRYCESNSLTCALELEAGGQVMTARYRLGELLSVEPDSELTAQIAEAKQGAYRFKLPRFELPAGARAKNGAAPASSGTPHVAARPAAPNVGAAFKPAAAPAVQPVRVAGAPHQRPTPAATPAAVRAVPAAASAARSPAAPAVAASARSASAASQARPAAAASQARPAAAASQARPAVSAEPVRPAPIAEVRAAPAEPARPAAAAPAPAPSPVAPAPSPSPAPAPAAAKPAAPSPAPEPAQSPAPAAAPAAVKSPVAKPAEARPARPAPREELEIEERSSSRAGLWIVMALVVIGLVVWFVMGAPLPK